MEGEGRVKMTAADSFNLERFVTAQAPVFETVLAEIAGGPKADPLDVAHLPAGRSSTARFYGIGYPVLSRTADDPDNPFRHALDRCCGGQPDEQTLTLLG